MTMAIFEREKTLAQEIFDSEASSRRFGLIDTVNYQLVQFAKDHLVLATKKTKKYIYHMIKEDN